VVKKGFFKAKKVFYGEVFLWRSFFMAKFFYGEMAKKKKKVINGEKKEKKSL